MKSKLYLYAFCCMLCAICIGQWSNPVPVLRDDPPVVGQSLVAGAGDTIWAAVVTGQPGAVGPYQVLACWTTGDTWSQPAEITPPDPRWAISEPGIGREASGRLWIAWYRGDYPTKDLDSNAVWTVYRDSTGWHSPARVFSGIAAEGPMSFADDAQGNWYLGFATLTPYSSAVYCRMDGDSWQFPRTIAQGVGEPIETNFSAPTLVTRPDSGVWAIYQMSIPSDSYSMMEIVVGDSSRWCWYGDGSSPAAAADSSGRLRVIQSLMGGFLMQAAVIEDSVEVALELVSEYSVGRACAAADPGGRTWAAWQARGHEWVAVNYTTGGSWSTPEQTSALAAVPKGIAADASGRIYVLLRTTAGQLYSVYRTPLGIRESGPREVTCFHLPTVVRDVLFLPRDMTELPGNSDRVPRPSLLDATGRIAMELKPGANDVRALAPGVYFVRDVQAQAVRKVVVAR